MNALEYRPAPRRAVFIAMLLFAAGSGGSVFALGTEEFGNKPVGPNPQWPAGLLEVVNDTHRIYGSWVNGNENFYFSGDALALNATLEAFSKVKMDAREVVLLPVPGEEKTFDGKPVSFNWRLHAPSGIYLSMALREKDSGVYPAKPALFIHVSGEIALEKLRFPKGLSVLDGEDMVALARRGLDSKNGYIRAQGAYLLGEYSFAEGAVDLLIKALEDPDPPVVHSAAGALGRAGKLAEKALPALKKRPEGNCKEAAAAIEGAKAPPEDEVKRLRETQRKIRELKEARRRET